MDNHVHKWEWNKYYECALQCTKCKKIIGQKDILALIEAAQQKMHPTGAGRASI